MKICDYNLIKIPISDDNEAICSIYSLHFEIKDLIFNDKKEENEIKDKFFVKEKIFHHFFSRSCLGQQKENSQDLQLIFMPFEHDKNKTFSLTVRGLDEQVIKEIYQKNTFLELVPLSDDIKKLYSFSF